jgi:hypothetical protein
VIEEQVDTQDPNSERSWLATDRRPAGVSDATVEATGKVGEAMEWIERARGRLYDFHQMMGRGDLLFGEAVELLRAAGHDDEADELERDIVGRNVLEGRWTFQIIEEFDLGYYEPCRAASRRVDDLVGGHRHVYESEMKEARRTHGRRHHEQRPAPGQ